MSYTPMFYAGQTDTLPPYAVTLLHLNGTAVNLTGASSVTFVLSSYLTGVVVDTAATIVSAGTGQVSYSWQPGDLATPGVYSVEWVVSWTAGGTTTYPIHGYNFITVLNNLAMGYPNVSPTFNTIHSSTAAPTSANGNNGDFWYNTATSYFYGPKAAGTWPAGYLLNASLLSLNQIGVPTTSLNLNNQKIIDLANGAAKNDAAAFGQIPQMGLDVTAYGADPTGTTDSTSAFTNALSTLYSAGGGKILIPSGKYVLSGSAPINLSGMSNITFEGTGGFNPAGAAGAGTVLYYEGASAADCFDVTGAGTGIVFRNIAFNGVSSSWTGNYINVANSASVLANLSIENCEFLMTNTTSASGVKLGSVAAAVFKNCSFSGGVAGIASNATYTSTEVNVQNCYFTGSTTNLQFSGQNLTALSNYFTGGTTGIQVSGGSSSPVIKGNNFNSLTTGIVTVDTVGVDISNNSFTNCTTATTYNTAAANLATNGNFENGLTGWTALGSATQSVIFTDTILGDAELGQYVTNGSVLGGAQNTSFTGVAATAYQVSCWVKRTSGTGQPVLKLVDSTNSITGTSSALNTTGTWTRLTATVTTGASTPTVAANIQTTVSTSATTFEVGLLTVRQSTVLLPEVFSLNYLSNVYAGTYTNTITGAYTQCGVVEDPVGAVAQYGNNIFGGLITQNSGFDTLLGNNLRVPGTATVTGNTTVNGATTLAPTSTSATGLTVNNPSGTSVDVADLQVNSVTAWKVNSTGTLAGTQPETINPTSTSAVPLTVNTPSGSSAAVALFQQNGTPVASINSAGNLAILNSLQLDASAANATKPIIIPAYASYTPTLAGTATLFAVGNATIVGAYIQIGKLTFVEITITAGSSTVWGTAGTGVMTVSLPKTPVGYPILDLTYVQGGGWWSGRALNSTSGGTTPALQVYASSGTAAGAAGVMANISSTVPVAKATGDVIYIKGWYEATT